MIDSDDQYSHSVGSAAEIQGKDSLIQHLLLASNLSSSSRSFSTASLRDHSYCDSLGCSIAVQDNADIAIGRIFLGHNPSRIGHLDGNLDDRILRAYAGSNTGLDLDSNAAADFRSRTAGSSVINQSLLIALDFRFDSSLDWRRNY